MTRPAILKGLLFAGIFSLSASSPAQTKPLRSEEPVITEAAKPFRVLTNGNRITVKATGNFSKLLVWTSSGHRILEQSNLNTATYSFNVPTKEKIFFILVEFVNGRRFTEKIGVK